MSGEGGTIVNIQNTINISTDHLTASSEGDAGRRDGTGRLGVSCHIGVDEVDPDHYDGWSGPLMSCELDAKDMFEIANALGYKSRVLLTRGATRSAVTAEIDSAAERLHAGDIFFLSYSGHGSSVPDHDLDEEEITPGDLKDETWCLFDGQLIDDELAFLWSRFRAGVRVIVLSDSCHSGTVVRAALNDVVSTDMNDALAGRNTDFRIMPTRVAQKTYSKNKDFYLDVQRATPGGSESVSPEASVRLISGCQDNQLSRDGEFNGRFTSVLKRVYGDGSFSGNYAEFHREIVTRMPSDQTPNHLMIGARDARFDAQRPFEIG